MVSRPPEPIPGDIEPDGDDLPAPPDEGDLPLPVPGGDDVPPPTMAAPDGGSAIGDAKLRDPL